MAARFWLCSALGRQLQHLHDVARITQMLDNPPSSELVYFKIFTCFHCVVFYHSFKDLKSTIIIAFSITLEVEIQQLKKCLQVSFDYGGPFVEYLMILQCMLFLFCTCSIDQFITRLTASLSGCTDGIIANLLDGEEYK